MSHDYETADLMRALAHCAECQKEHDEALAGYEDHSWDYHGSDWIEALDKARAEVGVELRKVIASEVAKILAAKETP